MRLIQGAVLVIITSCCLYSLVNIASFHQFIHTILITLILLSIVYFVLKVILAYGYSKSLNGRNQTLFSDGNIFTIDQTGICQFSVEDIRQISLKSKVSWLGIYIHFEKNDDIEQGSNAYFLYKDRFSQQDYARISRIILYCQQSSQTNDT